MQLFSNELTKNLNIKYPVIQGGMAWVAEAKLAAAVSEAGGLGLIAGGSAPADVIRKEIIKLREMTDKPFGINIMLMSPFSDELSELVCEEKVPVVTTGAGSPGKYMEKWKNAGTVVIPVIPSVALARRMEGMGADAVVAEGCEAGGHIGSLTTMTLLPQVVDAVSIPVIAAGGIADARGVLAAFVLGAKGVQIGTRFLASDECVIHDNYKQLVLKAKDRDSAVTGSSNGHPVRAIKSPLTKKILDMEKDGASFEELENMMIGSLRKAVMDGDLNEGSFMAGQIAGMINDIKPCREIIEDLFNGAEQLRGKFEE